MNRRYLWEFTAEEWIGPRVKGEMNKQYAASARVSGGQRAGKVERVPVEEVWAEYSSSGALIFETENSTKVIGSMEVGGLSSIDPEFVGRGIVTRVAADYYFRAPRVDPVLYLKTRSEPLSVDGERYTARFYALVVERAVRQGLFVDARVIESAKNVRSRYEALRRGDDSSLQLLDQKERRRKESCGRIYSRYRWLSVSRSFMRWLSGAKQPVQVKHLEDMVVVVDD